MKAHPITDHPYRWIPLLGALPLAVVLQTLLVRNYLHTEWLPALIDGITTIGWFAILAYLIWFIVGFVTLAHTDLIAGFSAIILWLSGSFIVHDILNHSLQLHYPPFALTLPFRLLFAVPTFSAVILGYRLIMAHDALTSEREYPDQENDTTDNQLSDERIDRITVKDGARIHLIKTEEIIYIQACGDYVTLITPSGQFIKEFTMKHLASHLPSDDFIRIHRSAIVNVTYISRIELFGKESYQLFLKNGHTLRASLSGYRMLKERLHL